MFIRFLSSIGSLASIVNVSNHTKGISLNKQPCKARHTLINLNPDECNQGLHYPFIINLDKCTGSGSNLNDMCGRICVPDLRGGGGGERVILPFPPLLLVFPW